MTRQKVDPDKRQRTAHACESCKRRKQKCDGQDPCSACSRRSFVCTYEKQDPHYDVSTPSQASSSKRRSERPSESLSSTLGSRSGLETPALPDGLPTSGTTGKFEDRRKPRPEPGRSPLLLVGEDTEDTDLTSSNDEAADVHTMVRMLEDTQGRLQYIGDSANLSFLQLLRMIAETISGPSAFSLDPARHRITERQFEISPDVDVRRLLPTKDIAFILTNAFFTHTYGMIEVFTETSFIQTLEEFYRAPDGSDRIWLCHLYLVLALGLTLITPKAGSREGVMLDSLRSSHPHRAEEYYFAAKTLSDPLTGFEDAGFWSTQALTLMSLFMLYQSRRNTAYVYTGMAIRSAHALGVHREEVLIVFQPGEQAERRKLWRSLSVLDTFLSVSLGRPLAASDEESSDSILHTAESEVDSTETRRVCTAALKATLRSCHAMGAILRKAYYPRRISIHSAKQLAKEIRAWPEKLPEFLHWRTETKDDVRQAIAMLHCNLMYCHSIILLSRPFFLHLLSNEIQRERLKLDVKPVVRKQDMQKFASACIDACIHTIAITYTACKAGHLPRLNTFPSYFVFSAALVIFMNELAGFTPNELSGQTMRNSIIILEYCGQSDPQAARTAVILRDFGDVIHKQNLPPPQLSTPAFAIPLPDRPHYAANQPAPTLPSPYPFPGAHTPSAYGPGYMAVPGNAPLQGSAGSTIPPLQVNSGVPPVNTSGLQSTLQTNTWLDQQDPFATDPNPNAFLGFDNILPSVSENEFSSADEDFNFDRLWEWPSNDPLPTAGPSAITKQGPKPV